MKGLLSKEYAKQRAALINWSRNDSLVLPGDPYPFEGKTNPYTALLEKRSLQFATPASGPGSATPAHDGGAGKLSFDQVNADLAVQNDDEALYHDRLWRGTTSVEAADKEGWVVSIPPSGGWLPACIAGQTGIGMSQRLQSFVLDSLIDPFNVIEPGKRSRVTLTPSLALKDGKPFLAFAVQGGDTQDQNLLQFFLNMVEFGMTVQQATEAANINSDQLWLSLGGSQLKDRLPKSGRIVLNSNTPEPVQKELEKMGYTIRYSSRTSGPINAIYFDWEHGSFWGGSSNHGEDYGIGW
jgi:gamma-glutamyltranspeptidase/glutathione hydrolase